MIGLACLAGLLACWTLAPTSPTLRLRSVLGEARPGARPVPGWLPGLGAIGFVGLGLLLVAPRTLVWAVPLAVATLTAVWLVRQARSVRLRRAATAEVVEVCQAVAAQLRVGQIPAATMARVAVDSPLLRPVAASQAIGGDVSEALHALAVRPGCEGLAELARSWRLCERTGAPVADAVGRVANGLRADAAAERQVQAELAVARATGRLLALLPGLGIGLGYLSGGDPVRFLVGTSIGQLCLAAAICLVCVGLIWTTLLAEPAGSGREAG